MIEAGLHLHNFLVKYRLEQKESTEEYNDERRLLVDEVEISGELSLVVTNGNSRGEGGRPTNEEKERRMKGLLLIDELNQSISNHNMVRRRKEADIRYDASNHIV